MVRDRNLEGSRREGSAWEEGSKAVAGEGGGLARGKIGTG